MMNKERQRILLVSSVLLVCFLFLVSSSSIISTGQSLQSNFQDASSAIVAAYAQIRTIEQNGGNPTTLAARLNVAISLYNKAEVENGTNQSQASLDFQNATQIANSVRTQALPIAQAAESQKKLQDSFAIGESAAVIIGTILVYFFGGRIYDWTWLYQRKKYVVRRIRRSG
jgi:F0F1-type ATP synthase assembly protein I